MELPEETKLHKRPPKIPMKRWLLWLAILACLVLLAGLLSTRLERMLLYGDALMFWAPGRLVLQGENPYDLRMVTALAEAARKHPNPDDPVPLPLMVYPPWVLPPLMVLGALDFPLFRLAWLAINLCALLMAADITWCYFDGPARFRPAAWLFALTFAPGVRALSIGNLTPLMLLGLVLFMRWQHSSPPRRTSDVWAGLALALVTIKPQLLYLILLAVLLWSVLARRWYILLGMALYIGLATAVPALFRPSVLVEYIQATLAHPWGARAIPTLGSLLRLLTGTENFWLQFAPTAVGLVWFSIYWRKWRQAWQWERQAPLLVAVSLATSAYAWTYDQVFWVLPLLATAAGLLQAKDRRIFWLFLAGYGMVNLAVFIIYARTNEFWLFWLPVVLLIGFWLVKWRSNLNQSG